MDKQFILAEIVRTAKQNGGKALGRKTFSELTGINEYDWCGKFWARWSDALIEAGFEPNSMQAAFDDSDVLEKVAQLVAELGKYPTVAELKLKRTSDNSFPSKGVIARLGTRAEVARKLIAYCSSREQLRGVAKLCQPIAAERPRKSADVTPSTDGSHGFVYLMRSGKYYKIGHTNALDRRQYEIGLQLPEGIQPVHSIRTDDPAGIEAYWHRRFKGRHMNGEWFNLTPRDVAAFRRRKFM